MVGEWRIRNLAELTVNFDSIRVPVKETDRIAGPHPYYGASGVVDHVNGFLFDGEYLLVAEDGENLRTRTTPIAFIAKGKFWVNNHAHIIQGNRHADTRFLMYALAVTDISGYLTGSTMPKLTQGNLNRIPIMVPPLPEQRAIAHILGTLDDKIELNRRMNETLEGMARALFKSWFVDFDPVRAKLALGGVEGMRGEEPAGLAPQIAALFPDELVETELGLAPRGWEVATIGDLAEIVGGSTPSTKEPKYWEEGTHCWATPKDLSGLSVPVLLETERRVTDAGLARISSGLLPVGTVLLSSRAPIGYLAITAVPVAINQGFIALKPLNIVSNLFLLLWCSFAHDEIMSRANGSTFLEISKANFRPIVSVVPPPEIMAAFDKLARPIYERIVQSERETRSLVALRDTLLPRLISGELRVVEAEQFAMECF